MQDDFLEILDQLFDRIGESGANFFPGCRDLVTARARALLTQPEMAHVPGYKLTTLMTDLVNIAATLSAESWLGAEEATAQFELMTGNESPLVQSLLSEAAMEHARIEPVMLAERYETPYAERNAILRVRLKRMLIARQRYNPLPSSYIRILRIAGNRALNAACFKTYRSGPMLQFFADMIREADAIAESTYDEFAGVSMLSHMLREDGKLWKLYRFKSARFAAKPGDPLHEGIFSSTRANMLYVPDRPGHRTYH